MKSCEKENIEIPQIDRNVDADTGLSSSQIKERMKYHLVNEKPSDNQYSISKIICSNVFTYFNFIFFIFAGALLFVRSYNNLAFMIVIFTNTFIGIVQEVRSKHALNKLNLLSAHKSKVIRCGSCIKTDSEKLLLDDIVMLEAGNQIPADAVLYSGEVYVNESLLTGEADEIKKLPGDTLLSGSFIVSGKCRARLTAVGRDSFAAKLTLEAKKAKKRQRPGMMKSLNLLIMIIGVIIIPFAAAIFIMQYDTLGLSMKESVENAVASSIGMIPEGLYLLTSVALAASTVRLARGETLVHDMKCIESLARVDLICVDKTGTITSADMSVSGIMPMESKLYDDERLMSFAYSMETENITLAALKSYFSDEIKHKKKYEVSERKEFSSVYKYSAARFSDGKTYVLGAPEIILKDNFEKYKKKIEERLKSGERALVFARVSNAENDKTDFSDIDFCAGAEPAAFVFFDNPIRESARDTFKYFADQGVDVKVISGDNPRSVSAVAIKAGICGGEKYVDASKLDEKEITSKKMLDYTVFGRVSPEQKRLLVRTFKKYGKTVAMTGDGVNDVLALKEADCSVAMASGSEAASNISDLVLVNSDFSNMPKVVGEGRRVINNIERTASLFLVKNIFSFIMTVITIASVSKYPLKPVQLSLASCMMIGIPSFILALEPNRNLVRGKFLRNVLKNAFPSAITAVILVSCSLILADSFNIDYGKMSTVSCIVYTFSAYMMLYKVCRPFNVWHGILFVLMGMGFALAAIVLPEFFNLSSLDAGCTIITVLLIIPAYPIQNAFEILIVRLFGALNKASPVVKKK